MENNKQHCKCHCHSEVPEGVQCRCIKNCEHCQPQNFPKQKQHDEFIEEAARDFYQYMEDGYSGGCDGLRCTTCDAKFRGEASTIQLCPMCAVKELLKRHKEYIEGKARKVALDDMFMAITELAEPDERQFSAGDLNTNLDKIHLIVEILTNPPK